MSEQNTSVGTNPSGTTSGVRKTIATQALDAKKCEIAIHIGVFFDGTGNARDGDGNTNPKWQHEAKRKHSNVARLFAAYPDRPFEGCLPMYVPGIGTPFTQIGETEPAMYGDAGGEGGDGRINFGLLHVFNAAHRAVSPARQPLFQAGIVKALCRNGLRGKRTDELGQVRAAALAEAGDEAELKRVGMESVGGLLMSSLRGRAHAEAFYKAQAARLENLIYNVAEKPKLKEIFIDVFGFSRGAAEARTFCSWLDKIFVGNRLFGVVAHIRFLGLFDTVASVGLNSSANLGGQGHFAWADPQYLRIGGRVNHCEHHVAMHENRPSFPLEFTEFDGSRPPNSRQFAYPGMHSDVGGGYAPGEQGRWLSTEDFEPGKGGTGADNLLLGLVAVGNPHMPKETLSDLDSRKVSQITLNHMHDAAQAAGVPLKKKLARGQGANAYDPFAVHPITQRAFDEFMASDSAAKPLREWLVPYLSWRYQVRHRYAELATTTRASAQDRDDLSGANRTLLLDIDALENTGMWQRMRDHLTGSLGPLFDTRSTRANRLAPEASEVLAQMKAHAPVVDAAARMFMNLCHDSYGGFRPFDAVKPLGFDILPGSWEAEGYLRYRNRYEGDSRRLASIESTTVASATA